MLSMVCIKWTVGRYIGYRGGAGKGNRRGLIVVARTFVSEYDDGAVSYAIFCLPLVLFE